MRLLDSTTPIVAENAALILANCTHESDEVCVQILKSGELKTLAGYVINRTSFITEFTSHNF